jgi:hypothetical protein
MALAGGIKPPNLTEPRGQSYQNASSSPARRDRALLPLHVQPEERAEPQFSGLLEETFDKVCPGKR